MKRSPRENDTVVGMQIAAKVKATTVFASYLARLQAHFESMTVEQRSNIIHLLYGMLEAWRGEWVMALTSVSRDRADRLWALLVTYQGEPACITTKDQEWAEARWQELVDMLQIDAVKPAHIGDFMLAPQTGVISVEDTQTEKPSSSQDVLVKRTPGGKWEQATAEEKAELAAHEADTKDAEDKQAEHVESLWAAHQAAEARVWDEWAVQTELERPTRTRPLKRFKVQVTVTDAEHNEVAVANLNGELEVGDSPLVSFAVTEEVVQVPHDDQEGDAGAGARKQEDDNGEVGSDRADTVLMGPSADEVDEHIDANLTDLGAIMDTVMGRQWFQLFVNREVDDEMVRKRWGSSALEVFQVNRDMMELMQGDQDKNDRRQAEDSLRVRPMSEGEESLASSGAKVFPRRTIVAGRRHEDSADNDAAEGGGPRDTNEGDCALETAVECDQELAAIEQHGQHEQHASTDGGHAGVDTVHGMESGEGTDGSQQILENTQMDVVETADGAEGEGGGSSAMGTTGATEGLHDGSFGDGKVQADLQSWLK